MVEPAAQRTSSKLTTARKVEALRSRVAQWRSEGDRIGFVPTMGALHEGHLSLVEHARRATDRVVVSIFVNPTQFGPGEDLEKYPRTPEADAERLAGAGCDLLFLPSAETIYPDGHSVTVQPGSAARWLEGVRRPGHFCGVVTVVSLLFHLVQPDVAVFGRKDAQQLAVIEQLVRDLRFPIEILPGATVREADGLAMSSRNRYLSAEERRAATVLHRSLRAAREMVLRGERSAERVRARLREVLASEPLVRVDYAEVVDATTFAPVDEIDRQVVVPLAAFLGETRLIDNIALDPTIGNGSAIDKESPCNA